MTRLQGKGLGYLLIGASALALAACGGGGGGDQAADDTAPAVDTNGMEETADDAANAAEEAGEDMADAAGDAAETVEQAGEDAAAAAEDAADDAADAADDAMDDAGDAMDDAAEAAEDAGEDTAAATGDMTEISQEQVSDEVIAQYQSLTGDPRAGQRVFAQCMTCHVVQEGQNRVGPSLYNIIGREAGTIEGFRYSDANKNSGIIWTEPTMFAYLENPQAFIPGTIMAFPGVPDPQDRADVIAYIKQESGQ